MGEQMAILFESSTHIEYLMREALTKENLTFQEQYRLYSGGKFSEVKYVADFFLENKGHKLIIECDGFHYHAGRDKYKKQLERDQWLNQRGYIVLHFSTNLIVSNISAVIQTIKYNLKLPCDVSQVSKNTANTASFTRNKSEIKDEQIFDVILCCYYRQMANGICVTYKYKSIAHNLWSDERIKICQDVPEDFLEVTAIYLALLDLKKSVKLKIYYSGMIYHDDFNVSKKFRSLIRNFERGIDILNIHTISMKYIGFHGDYRHSNAEQQKTMNELRSRCTQISNNVEKQSEVSIVKYIDLFSLKTAQINT
jgi:very-short-patch-repair endonuclease